MKKTEHLRWADCMKDDWDYRACQHLGEAAERVFRFSRASAPLLSGQVRHLVICSRTRDFHSTARALEALVCVVISWPGPTSLLLQQNAGFPRHCTYACRPGLPRHSLREIYFVICSRTRDFLSTAPVVVDLV